MKKLFLLIAAVLLISIISGCSSSGTSTPDTTPPTVISFTPSDGAVNVPVSANITVTFSKSMDTASAQSAFTMNSATPTGSFSWSGNTMTFTPGANLAVDTIYNCTEGITAKDTSGNALSGGPYTWAFTTDSPADTTPPTVISVIPLDNATGVSVSSAISVTFSEIMNTASAEGVFSINPVVAGTFSWSGNTMTFTPSANLDQSKSYICTAGVGAKDAAGNALAIPYIWKFTTAGASGYGVTIEYTGGVINSGTISGYGGNITSN